MVYILEKSIVMISYGAYNYIDLVIYVDGT